MAENTIAAPKRFVAENITHDTFLFRGSSAEIIIIVNILSQKNRFVK